MKPRYFVTTERGEIRSFRAVDALAEYLTSINCEATIRNRRGAKVGDCVKNPSGNPPWMWSFLTGRALEVA